CMTKLLIATTVPTTIRSFLLPFVQHFRAKGWHVDAMAHGITKCPECVAACSRVREASWSRNPLDPRNLLAVPRHVHNVVTHARYNLVHVHTPIAAFVARYALRRRGEKLGGNARLPASDRDVRVVYTAHGFHFYRGGPRLRGA